jgi:hypothetical protein
MVCLRNRDLFGFFSRRQELPQILPAGLQSVYRQTGEAGNQAWHVCCISTATAIYLGHRRK